MARRTASGSARVGSATRSVALGLCATVALLACSDDSGDQEAFCAAATDRTRFESTFEGLDPADVDEAITMFRDARESEEELRSTAPEAVRADIDVLIAYLDDLVEGLETTATADGERPPIYDELQSRSDQVEAASARLQLYVETNC